MIFFTSTKLPTSVRSSIRAYIPFLFCILCSCNHKLVVHKKDVVQEQKGFLLLYYPTPHQEMIFFPFKDTVDERFLNESHRNGYRIRENGLEYFKDLAVKHSFKQNVLIDGKSVLSTDTLNLIPVTIKYYWGDNWHSHSEKDEKVLIHYEFNNRGYELHYRIYDSRIILGVTLTRKKDLQWLNENYQNYAPSRR